MKFVFLCDDIYLKGDNAAFVNNFPTNHELVTMSGEAFLQAKGVPENTFGLLVERFTWQKNFSLFRYFGLLPVLEMVPLAVVSRSRRVEPLKGRSALRGQEMIIAPNASSEELYTAIDRFVAAPPQIHTYPRGACKMFVKKTVESL
ncbi:MULTISPECIES: hypothetical protein [Fibrobacter]|uniref:Uncharacterized protein n=1 Tax=Fibrobacter intestinalis TaxID=28122 RepID=A0A1M6T0L3_9BACT|nr:MULTISPECIES: hypothetical protein [Fibrobacter]MDD7299932.1 hypothetical protein [Fibrobacter intestinalis]PBC72625.1 hypothetical protein BGW94_0199 [Fibrobacter sp. NR9]SHK50496.1 hypothetical protein SAMN05720469_10828 [Fibrobacter intestinalis]SJZ47827.1 hypothetical protein SAMN02745108_00708 [Fibrobacter intestinalis]